MGLARRAGREEPRGRDRRPGDWPAYPTKRGFDYYFGYVRHVDGHWHYPKEDGRQVWENDREVSADLAGCYTTDLFTARAKKWITDAAGRASGAAVLPLPGLRYAAREAAASARALSRGRRARRAACSGSGKPGAMINTANGTPDSYIHPDYAKRPGTTTTIPPRRSSRGPMSISAMPPTCGASTIAWAICSRCSKT